VVVARAAKALGAVYLSRRLAALGAQVSESRKHPKKSGEIHEGRKPDFLILNPSLRFFPKSNTEKKTFVASAKRFVIIALANQYCCGDKFNFNNMNCYHNNYSCLRNK